MDRWPTRWPGWTTRRWPTCRNRSASPSTGSCCARPTTATVRTETDGAAPMSWLRIPKPERVLRIQVQPLTMGSLHAVVSQRLGRPFARPTPERIQDVSRGNPFYAIELARATESNGAEVPLPDTLTELVRTGIDGFGSETQDALLATACLTAPTLDIAATAISSGTNTVVGLLEEVHPHGTPTPSRHAQDAGRIGRRTRTTGQTPCARGGGYQPRLRNSAGVGYGDRFGPLAWSARGRSRVR